MEKGKLMAEKNEKLKENQKETITREIVQQKTKTESFNDDSLQSWVSEKSIKDFVIRVYRLGQNAKKEFLSSYSGEIPTENDIGLSFGGGSFLLLISGKTIEGKSITNTRTFNIGSHFNQKKIENDRNKHLESFPHIPQQGININSQNIVETITGIIAAVTPLVAVLQPLFQRQPNQTADKIMLNNMNTMNSIMKTNMIENSELYRDMQREMMDLKEEQRPLEVETPLALILFEKFAPMLTDFIPKILGGGVQSNVLKGMIKGAKEFQELAANPLEAQALVDLIAEEQGQEKAFALAEALGLDLGSSV